MMRWPLHRDELVLLKRSFRPQGVDGSDRKPPDSSRRSDGFKLKIMVRVSWSLVPNKVPAL